MTNSAIQATRPVSGSKNLHRHTMRSSMPAPKLHSLRAMVASPRSAPPAHRQTGKKALANTAKLADVDAGSFDAIFFPGGHGPMWDYPENAVLANLIEAFDEEHKPIGAVCHGPVALVSAKKTDGTPLVSGKKVTGFTNGEEAGVGLTEIVPFLLEDRLRSLGGVITNGPDFQPNVVTDGNLVTGQNPQSSQPAAEALLTLLSN